MRSGALSKRSSTGSRWSRAACRARCQVRARAILPTRTSASVSITPHGALGEHLEVGVARVKEATIVELGIEATLHEAQRYQHGGEGMGDDAVAPVVVARLADGVGDEDVPRVQVVVVEARGTGDAARRSHHETTIFAIAATPDRLRSPVVRVRHRH